MAAVPPAVPPAVPNVQSVVLGQDVIDRQRIFAATDAAHDHGAGWATAGGGILTRALQPPAMTEVGFIEQYSTTSSDGTRYKNAEARRLAAYDVPFYPRTDSWEPGFVFAPFGPGESWLTAHDAGSSHPGQRPCLHFNLADTASRLRSKANEPVFCKLPNLFLSANDIGINPEYVEAVAFYGFSRYTNADTGNAAGVKPFNDQKDGGKVKCKILVKMSPAANRNFAWYDLTDVETASRPNSFSAAVASAKWKVLNTNAGYFMGNENSAGLFTPDADPTKVLLATIAKLIGDMTTALASSDWMAKFHPGGENAISNDWIDAWTGMVAFSGPIHILGESGDRLQVWQGADRNGATLYTGSRQNENKMQTATFIPGQVDPGQQRRFMEGKLQFLHDTLDNQYSTLVAEVNTYIQDVTDNGPRGLFNETAYANVKGGNYPYVTTNLLNYLYSVRSQIAAVYDEVKAEGRILDQTHPDKYHSLKDEDINGLHDVLSMQIVDLMPQKTSFFIKEPTKLHKAFQIMKGHAVLPSPSDAITKINTTARYRTQSGGARFDEALDAFAIALMIPMPLDPADPMFLQFANMIPSAVAAAAAAVAPRELGENDALPLPPIDFAALNVKPSPETITRAAGILNAIREPIPLYKKWNAMKRIWGGVDEAFDDKDIRLSKEIKDSIQIEYDAYLNNAADIENLANIVRSRVVLPTQATADTADDLNLIRNHFIPYGVRIEGPIHASFSSDIKVYLPSAAPTGKTVPQRIRDTLLPRSANQRSNVPPPPPYREKLRLRGLDPYRNPVINATRVKGVKRTIRTGSPVVNPTRRNLLSGKLTIRTPVPSPYSGPRPATPPPPPPPYVMSNGGRKTHRRRRLPKLL